MKRARPGPPQHAKSPDTPERDPDFSQMTAQQEVDFLIKTYGIGEDQAWLMTLVERGEISGDTFEIDDADETRSA